MSQTLLNPDRTPGRPGPSRRGFLAGLGALGAAATLAACSGGSPTSSTGGGGATYAGGKVDLAFWNGFTGGDGPVMQDLVDRFNAEHEAITVKMTTMEWADYHAKLASGREFSGGPPIDEISTPIYGELGDPPPVGSVAVVTRATIANGAYAEAIAWGVEMAQYVEGVSGLRSTFLVDDFGPFGQVRWIGIAPDAATADAAGQKVNADPGYIDKLSAAGKLFAQGSGHRGLASRVA